MKESFNLDMSKVLRKGPVTSSLSLYDNFNEILLTWSTTQDKTDEKSVDMFRSFRSLGEIFDREEASNNNFQNPNFEDFLRRKGMKKELRDLNKITRTYDLKYMGAPIRCVSTSTASELHRQFEEIYKKFFREHKILFFLAEDDYNDIRRGPRQYYPGNRYGIAFVACGSLSVRHPEGEEELRMARLCRLMIDRGDNNRYMPGKTGDSIWNPDVDLENSTPYWETVLSYRRMLLHRGANKIKVGRASREIPDSEDEPENGGGPQKEDGGDALEAEGVPERGSRDISESEDETKDPMEKFLDNFMEDVNAQEEEEDERPFISKRSVLARDDEEYGEILPVADYSEMMGFLGLLRAKASLLTNYLSLEEMRPFKNFVDRIKPDYYGRMSDFMANTCSDISNAWLLRAACLADALNNNYVIGRDGIPDDFVENMARLCDLLEERYSGEIYVRVNLKQQ